MVEKWKSGIMGFAFSSQSLSEMLETDLKGIKEC